MLHFDAKTTDEACTFDLTPLIDIIFILLLFFILAAAFAVRGLSLDLPHAQSSQALSGRVVELHLLADGTFVIDGVPTPREEVRMRIQNLVRHFRTNPGLLVLKAAPAAPVESLIFLVDEVRLQGGEKLHIGTASPTSAHENP